VGDSSFRWSVNIFIPLVRWGGALVVGVNILVLPESSERQLRQTLVTSLDHIAIFLHLIAKTYTLTITDEERKVRDGLNQSIRVSGLPAQWRPACLIRVPYAGGLWSIERKGRGGHN